MWCQHALEGAVDDHPELDYPVQLFEDFMGSIHMLLDALEAAADVLGAL